jgi:hypothetical protein
VDGQRASTTATPRIRANGVADPLVGRFTAYVGVHDTEQRARPAAAELQPRRIRIDSTGSFAMIASAFSTWASAESNSAISSNRRTRTG